MISRRNFLRLLGTSALLVPFRKLLANKLNIDFIEAIRNCSSGKITLVEGNYLIENPLEINSLSGKIKFGDTFTLTLNNPESTGVIFKNCQHLDIVGGTFQYKSEFDSTQRIKHGGILHFIRCNAVTIKDFCVQNSTGVGLLFTECVDSEVSNGLINFTKADGVHFANCSNPKAYNLRIANTGDDGLAFVSYSTMKNYSGGLAKLVNVKHSEARGIAIVGQSNVQIYDFTISDTVGSGLLVAKESFYKTNQPASTTIQKGVIKNPGKNTSKNSIGNGVFLSNCGDVSISQVYVEDPKDRCIGVVAKDSAVTLEDVTCVGGTSESIGVSCKAFKASRLSIKEAAKSAISIKQTQFVSIENTKVFSYGLKNKYFPSMSFVEVNSVNLKKIDIFGSMPVIKTKDVNEYKSESLNEDSQCEKVTETWSPKS